MINYNNKTLKILLLGIFLIISNIELVYANINIPTFEKINCKIKFKNKNFLDITLDLADTAEKRAFGLMHRKALSFNNGMLFKWKDNQIRNFWMHNTFVNLDLFFIDEKGIIIEIYRNAIAMDKSNIRSKEKVRFVLELNAGELKGNIGDRLNCPFIK